MTKKVTKEVFAAQFRGW